MRAVNWGKGLSCEECGCCSADGRGWIGQVAFDPEDGEPPKVIVFCPPCAASEFGYRPDVAGRYVCAWEPLPEQTRDSSA